MKVITWQGLLLSLVALLAFLSSTKGQCSSSYSVALPHTRAVAPAHRVRHQTRCVPTAFMATSALKLVAGAESASQIRTAQYLHSAGTDRTRASATRKPVNVNLLAPPRPQTRSLDPSLPRSLGRFLRRHRIQFLFRRRYRPVQRRLRFAAPLATTCSRARLTPAARARRASRA